MIRVIFTKTRRHLKVEAHGHALFDKKGKDLVCCAVSTLLQAWNHATMAMCGPSLNGKGKDGFLSVTFENSERAEILYDALLLNMVLLEKQYPDNIKVKTEDKHGS